jgi:tRNA-Thr(GGU) m(6)t(6)A37 methyltransferase TsaA
MPDPDQHDRYQLRPIGVVHSPYETPADAPHQGFADDREATLEVFEQYADALADVEDIIRLTVVYWAHEADRSSLVGADGVGAFARRGPNRPNPVSICTGTLLDADGRHLRLRGLDAVDGSPLLDLKPALQAER